MRPTLLVLALAFAVRLALGLWLLSAGDQAYVLASDDGDAYVISARHLAFGEPVVFDQRLSQKWQPGQDPASRWPPAYWLFLAAQYRLFGYQHLSTIFLQAALGAAGAVAAYQIAQRLLNKHFALAAGLLVAVSSTLAYLSAALYAEALYIPLLLLAVRLTLSNTNQAALAAGLALGLAEATRPLAIALLPVMAWYSRHNLLPLVAGFAAATAAFLVRDVVTLGYPALFTAGGAAALTDSLAQAPSLAERLTTLFLVGGWAPIADPYLPQPLIHRLAFWLIALGGAVGLIRSPYSGLLMAAAAAIILPALAIGLPLVRYRAPADPLFLIWFAAGIQQASTLLIHKLRVEEASTHGRIQSRARDPVLR